MNDPDPVKPLCEVETERLVELGMPSFPAPAAKGP
jgi:hypothetical protein